MKAWKSHWANALPTSEESLLVALQSQFKHRQIYSYIGTTLLSINPCRPSVQFYTADLVQTYQQNNVLQLPPHIYGVAEYAYHNMREYLQDQCVLITGVESGSGKTETCKYTIQYLMSSRKTGEVRTLREQIVTANLLLEAFGNAKSKLNDNSSRFGKFFDIEFDFKGDAAGANITQFLLEKSRVIRQPAGERSFHIFYQLVTGANVQLLSMWAEKNLKLQRNFNAYQLLRHSKCFQIEGLDDRKQFILTKACLQTLCFDESEQQFVWNVLASILKLGNLGFLPKTGIDGTESCSLANEYELYELCELLLIDVFSLQSALTQRTIQTRHETLISDLTPSEAVYAKDALCKALYNRLFTWIVNRINAVIRSKRVGKRKAIGIFDVFGFENLEINGYEQFLINFCNEKLQQVFIETSLKQEQEVYIQESINWVPITYINSELCDIIEKSVFPLLNEESLQLQLNESQLLHQMVDFAPRYLNCLQCLKQPTWTDAIISAATTGNQSSSSCSSSPACTLPALSAHIPMSLVVSAQPHQMFAVQHYAAIVTYNIADFQLKNAEHLLSRDVCSAMFNSEFSALGELFPEANPARSQLRRPVSRCAQLSTGFLSLLETIRSTRQLHFVHCIRPNRFLPTRQPAIVPKSTATNATAGTTSFKNIDSEVNNQSTIPQQSIPITPTKQAATVQLNSAQSQLPLHRTVTPMVSTSSSSGSTPGHKPAPIVITIALDSDYVLEQVRSLQLAAYARFKKHGYAYHCEYTYFVDRYSLTVDYLVEKSHFSSSGDRLQLLLQADLTAHPSTPLNGNSHLDNALNQFCPLRCHSTRTDVTEPPCEWSLHQLTQLLHPLPLATLTAAQAAEVFSAESLHRCCELLLRLGVQPEEIQLGRTRLFIRQLSTLFRLEKMRELRLDILARRIQRMWKLSMARRSFLALRKSQLVISRSYLAWKRKCFLFQLARHLPSTSPVCRDWPSAPRSLQQANYLIRKLYHKWRCARYRAQFDQTARNMMREKCTASALLRRRKVSYDQSVSHPFRGDYVRLRHNMRWKKVMEQSSDAFVVFADIINKVNNRSAKCVKKLLVLSTAHLLVLDHRTFQVKYRIFLSDILRISLSPYADDFLVIHIKPSEASKRKGAIVIETEHVIEVVAKLFLVIQNATGVAIDVQVAAEFDANFGKDTLLVIFKNTRSAEESGTTTKITRKTYRLEIQF